MVGGGIGVTPYASILNDLVFGTSTNRYSGVSCKKVSTKAGNFIDVTIPLTFSIFDHIHFLSLIQGDSSLLLLVICEETNLYYSSYYQHH